MTLRSILADERDAAILALWDSGERNVSAISSRIQPSFAQIGTSVPIVFRTLRDNGRIEAPKSRGPVMKSTFEHDTVTRVDREPCFSCGVPRDRHANHGCKRWRGMA